MKTKTEHTPTPFEFIPETVKGEKRFKQFWVPKWVIKSLQNKPWDEIVRAVNSHEALLSTLKTMVKEIETAESMDCFITYEAALKSIAQAESRRWIVCKRCGDEVKKESSNVCFECIEETEAKS